MSRNERIALGIHRPDVVDGFWKRVDKSGECWEWTGYRLFGYGMYSIDRRFVSAHRFAWALAHGCLAEDILVCHTCDNRACVRADHLFLGTYSDNNRDMVRKGRFVKADRRGELNSRVRLTPDTVRAIRAVQGKSNIEIGRMFGISPRHAGMLRDRTRWAHLE